MFKVNNNFIVDFEHISHLALVFVVNFEQVNADLGETKTTSIKFNFKFDQV